MDLSHGSSTHGPSLSDGLSILRETPGWWRQESTDFLIDVLTCINDSRQRRSPVDRDEDLSRAMNLIGNAVNRRRQKSGSLPDERISRETQTDQSDSANVVNELNEFFDQIFELPFQRLAVYGSLRPGESNAGQMAGIVGQWLDGVAQGIVTQPGEYLEFTWLPGGGPVPVKVLVAPGLREHFPRLAEFEGPDYRRSLVPVEIDGVIQVCNIYEGRSKNPA